ncbi:CHAT domain-containing protein [uncultured Roseobacter sp.]|uniref:CHAT domain-containing protein n=1 Tax=uncultured Roseobacter sp. TaxID=114847 RepID=UPI002613CE3A|nr:CHAT domain-containing tetratricopeptide repeat protein [uncultured Roseobacter sp.]
MSPGASVKDALAAVGALLGRGKFDAAAERLTSIDPGDDAAAQALKLRLEGAIAYRRNDLAVAIDLLARGIEGEPDGSTEELATALRDLANAHQEMGHADAAAEHRRAAVDNLVGRLSISPGWAIELAAALSGDLRHSGAQDPEAPLLRVAEAAQGLSGQAAVSVFVRLASGFLGAGAAPQVVAVLTDALERVRAMDSPGRRAAVPALLEAVATVQQLGPTDLADELLSLVEGMTDDLSPEQRHAALQYRAAHLAMMGDAEARVALDRVITHAEDGLRSAEAARAARATLGEYLAKTGDAEGAEEVLRTALEDADTADPVTIGRIAAELGLLADKAWRWRDAADLHGLALTKRRDALGHWHRATNSSRYELAEMSRLLGRNAEAELHYRDAIRVDDRIGDDGGEFGSKLRNNLAELLIQMGQGAAADVLLEEALERRVAAFGSDSESAWRSRSSRANWHLMFGDPQAAADLAEQALALPQFEGSGAWHLLQASALRRLGRFAEAEPILAQVFDQIPVDDLERYINWETYLDLTVDLALSRAGLADWPGVVAVLAKASEALIRREISLLQDSSAGQVLHHARRCHEILSIWMGAAVKLDPEARRAAAFLDRAADLTDSVKGLRTRYMRLRQPGTGYVEDLAPPDRRRRDQDRRARLAKLDAELAELELAGVPRTDRAHLAVRAMIEEAERNLASTIPSWKTAYNWTHLGADTLGLEILRIEGIEPAGQHAPPLSQDRYVALLVEGDGDATRVDLIDFGLADPIDTAVTDLRASLVNEACWAGRKPSWWRLSRFLGRKLLDPIAEALAKADRLFVAPDGPLGALPFEILRLSEGAYLDDVLKVCYLPRLAESGGFRRPLLAAQPPLVLGGPDYDLEGAFRGARGLMGTLERELSDGLSEQRFASLPQAEAEGRAVAATLDATAFCGRLALATVLQDTPAPEILHIATHGFCLPRAAAERGFAATLGNAVDRRMILSDAMQRSGLALAGANAVLDQRALPEEVGSGFLYAAQIQSLDLQRTDLVFLAACRSGLGEFEVGDGAQGLGRAFLAAGCRSVVTALWDIPDTASRKLVERFYQEVIAGVPRLDALRAARQAVRADHPNDPIYWAGLVLIGNPGPLGRFSATADLKVASVSMSEWDLRGAGDGPDLEAFAERVVAGEKIDWAERPGGRVMLLERASAKPDLKERDRVWVTSKRADLLNRLGDHDAAIALYSELSEDPEVAEDAGLFYAYNAAKIAQQKGDFAQALSGYTAVLERCAKRPDPRASPFHHAMVNRGTVFMATGRTTEAMADFKVVIEDTAAPVDQRFMAYGNRADVLTRTDPAAALADVEAALDLDVATPGERRLWQAKRISLLIAVADAVGGRAALQALEADLDGLPDEPETRRLRGFIQAFRRDLSM